MKEAVKKIREWCRDHGEEILIWVDNEEYNLEEWLLHVFGEDAKEISLIVQDAELTPNCTDV